MKLIYLMIPALTTFSLITHAEEKVNISANVTGVSQYIFRGAVLNDSFSFQGGFDADYKGFYAGAWGAEDQELGTEVDLYVGYNFAVNKFFNIDIGYLQYRYDDINDEIDEFHITTDFHYFDLTYHNAESGYAYYEANSAVELPQNWSLDLHAGYEKNDDKTYDVMATLNYHFDDNYSFFIGVSDKEDNSSEFILGLTGIF